MIGGKSDLSISRKAVLKLLVIFYNLLTFSDF